MGKKSTIILEPSRAATRLLLSMLIAALLLLLVYATISAGMPATGNPFSIGSARPGLNSTIRIPTLPSKESACSGLPCTRCISISQGYEQTIPPSQAVGSLVSFTHLVTNCSAGADAVTVTVNSTAPVWLSPVSSSFITSIAAYSSTPIIVSANILTMPEEGESPGHLWVTATSWADTSVEAATQDQVDVRWHYAFLPIVLKNYALCNGNFETGDLTCWTRYEEYAGKTSFPVSVVKPLTDSSPDPTLDYNHFDTSAVRIGQTGWVTGEGISQGCFGISHAATVADIPSPTLRFEYSLYSYDVMTGSDNVNFCDSLEVTINDRYACPERADVTVPDECLWRMWNPNVRPSAKYERPWSPDLDTYTSTIITLSGYRGKPVDIFFLVCNRVRLTKNTWAYIDNISGDLYSER